MPKSKYQLNVEKKLKDTDSKAGRKKYYDETINIKKSKSNVPFFVFILLCIVVGGSIIGMQVNKTQKEKEALEFLRPTYDYSDTETETITTTVITSGLKPGDTVEIEYKLWVDDDKDGYVDTSATPFQGPKTFPISNLKKGDLINGFYYNILGMEEGETKTFEIAPTLDEDNNGIDDTTGKELLGYGKGDNLYNKKLVFWVRIVSIS
jgi:hypothetical protein